MKKVILGAIFLFSIMSFGQNLKPKFGFGFNYSTENTVGINFIAKDKYSQILGLGIAIPMIQKNLIGDDYSSNTYDYVNYFSDQIVVNKVVCKDFSAYIIAGKEIKNFRITGKLGMGTKYKFTNYLDPDRIFGTNGHYYQKDGLDSVSWLLGANISYVLNKHIALDLGYDTFNHGTFGLTILF